MPLKRVVVHGRFGGLHVGIDPLVRLSKGAQFRRRQRRRLRGVAAVPGGRRFGRGDGEIVALAHRNGQAPLHGLETAGQHHRVRETLLRFFFQQLVYDSCEFRGRFRRIARDGIRFGVALQLQHFDQRSRAKRRPPGQQRVHQPSQTVLIAACRHGLAAGLFGRHVFGGAQHTAVAGQPRIAE